jgi:4-hydroxymandelate oxidase
MNALHYTRRQLLGGFGAAVAGLPLARVLSTEAAAAAAPTIDSGPRVTPLDEIVLVRELEESARLSLPPEAFAAIAGTERAGFERITLRPRVMIPTNDMNLSVELFGDRHFTPIIVGPVPDQRRFHAGAEMETVRGAAAARTAAVVSARSSVPLEQAAAAAAATKTPWWYQVKLDAETVSAVHQAVKAGARAVCVSLEPGASAPDWMALGRLRRSAGRPVLVMGVTTQDEARLALQQGVQGIIVAPRETAGREAPILALPSIVDAVGGKVPVLFAGSVRVGADIVKALAFGARAVLVSRPAMWALGAYGADGVQVMLELLQSELARAMAMMGRPNPKSLTRQAVKIHSR